MRQATRIIMKLDIDILPNYSWKDPKHNGNKLFQYKNVTTNIDKLCCVIYKTIAWAVSNRLNEDIVRQCFYEDLQIIKLNNKLH